VIRSQRLHTALLAIALLALLSLGCGSLSRLLATDTPEPTSTPTATATATATATQTATQTPTATATATQTPEPTATPTATQTPEPTPTAAAAATEPTEMEEGLVIVSHSGYADSSGVVYVVGEVYNNSEANYRWVMAECAFLDEDEILLAEAESYVYAGILAPGEKAPFKITLWEVPAGLDTYIVSVSGDETSEAPFVGIELLQESGSVDEENLTIIGEVTNTSETPASEVRIAASVYDGDGEIVDVGFTYAERDVFFQGMVSPFKLFISEVNGDPDRYELRIYASAAADWELEEYADLEIKSIDYTIDAYDDLVVVGEVDNTDDVNVAYIKTFASFYNEADELIGVEWSYAWADVLAPGEVTPFTLALFATPEDIDHWTVWAEGSRTDEEPVGGLAFAESDNALSDDYVATFTGTIENVGTEIMTAIEVAVTVYDAEGNVVMADWTWLEGDLAPGERMPCEFEVQTDETAESFELYVQGSVETE